LHFSLSFRPSSVPPRLTAEPEILLQMLMLDIIPQTDGASMTNPIRPAQMAKSAFTKIP
jgi:hypothetical protein